VDYNASYEHGHRAFAGGAYGSVWLAEKRGSPGMERVRESKEWRQSTYVLKKINTDCSEHLLAALREVHFGEKFRGNEYVARFVEHFRLPDSIWLVFYNEGRSLNDLLYTKKDHGDIVTIERSEFWKWLRQDEEGAVKMREIWRDVLKGVEVVHSKKTTHRDIKPGNIFVRQDARSNAVLGDFGSAVDKDALGKFYSRKGPSKAESSMDYAPPEVIFGSIPYSLSDPLSYDLWSVGVLFLEMWLGQSNVFELDQRVAARIDRDFPSDDGDDPNKALRYKLKAFMETCIYENFSSSPAQALSVTRKACSDKLGKHVKRLDPLGKGLDELSLDLVHRLLQWNPSNRLSASEALGHPCFAILNELISERGPSASERMNDFLLEQGNMDTTR
jgi:serine/threonine protein kinase